MALLNAPFRSTLLVALVGAALLACSSMLRAGSGFASMPMNIKELLADDERALPPPPPSAAAVAAALLPSTSRAPGTADAHSDNAVLLSAREAGDIHRRYGKIFRPWGKGMLGAKSYSLAPEDDKPFAYLPQQYFSPIQIAKAKRRFLDVSGWQMRKDLDAGCAVGTSAPFVLPVDPLHFAAPRRMGMFAYNPSVVRHGSGYLVSYRVDYQNGCVVERKGMTTQYKTRVGNRHSCVVRTDALLRPIGDARVLDACGRATTADSSVEFDAGTHLVDVRLTRGAFRSDLKLATNSQSISNLRGGGGNLSTGVLGPEEILLSYLPMSQFYNMVMPACKHCCMRCDKSTHIAHLRVTEPPLPENPPGGLSRSNEWSVSIRHVLPLCTEGLMGGRNHALFVGGDGRLSVQAWLYPKVIVGKLPDKPSAADVNGGIGNLPLFQVRSEIRLRAGATQAAVAQCAHLRISGTSSLVRLRVRGREAMLGVGHLHHAREPNRTKVSGAEMKSIRRGIAYFGSHYMHFFYLLDAQPPHALLAHSSEWCVPHSTALRECEVVQFVSGLELMHGDSTVLLMYGVNDCEAKSATLPLERVLGMLQWGAPD